MADITVLGGRQVTIQHTNRNYIVMAVIATIRVSDIVLSMSKDPGGKCPRCMTDTAILGRR